MEHRAMLYSLLASGFAVFSLAWGASDDMIKQFELVVLPDEVRKTFEGFRRDWKPRVKFFSLFFLII